MDIFYSVVNFFVSGGAFMFPILIVAAAGAAIALERYITLTRMRASNRRTWAQVEPVLMKGVIGIHLAIFLVGLIVFIFFAFLPPVVLTGLIVLNLALAYILCPRIESAID